MANFRKYTIDWFHKLKSKLLGGEKSDKIFKNMGILASGSGVAKVIGFATTPVITRIYSPEDFGVLAVFISILAILIPFATLRYSVTIPLPKNDGLAFNIVVLGSAFITLFAVITGMLFLFLGDRIFGFFNMMEIAAYWWLLVIGIVVAAVYELLSEWGTRVKAFIPIAKTKIWQATISAIVQIGMGLLGFKPFGLLLGSVANKGGGIFSLLRHFISQFRKNVPHISFAKIKFLFFYYRDLPFYRLPSQFLLVLAGKIPVLYFAYQFGAGPTGQLGLSLSVVGLPMTLLGGSTGKAFYAEIAKIGRNSSEQILQITKTVLKRLSLFGGVLCLGLMIASPVLFKIVFGGDWEQAGVFTSILAVYLFFQFISSPLVSIFNVYNVQSKYLEINIVRTILMSMIFGSSYYAGFDVYKTLLIYSLVLSCHYLFTFYQIFNVIKKNK